MKTNLFVRLLNSSDWETTDSRYGMNTNEAYKVKSKRKTGHMFFEYVLYNPHSNVATKEAYFHNGLVEEITKESHPEYFL